MRKSYILFAVALIVVILAFTFTRSYLTQLERETAAPAKDPVTRAEWEEWKITVDSRFDEHERLLLERLDSLEQSHRDAISVGFDNVDTTSEQTAAVADTQPVTPVSPPDSTVPYVPTEQDNEIYVRYLKKRWALPNVMTHRELETAKQEIRLRSASPMVWIQIKCWK